MFFGTPAFGYGDKWPARAHASFPLLKLLDLALALAVERVIYLLRGQELQGKVGKVSMCFLLAFFSALFFFWLFWTWPSTRYHLYGFYHWTVFHWIKIHMFGLHLFPSQDTVAGTRPC